jgi:hypothetical protein
MPLDLGKLSLGASKDKKPAGDKGNSASSAANIPSLSQSKDAPPAYAETGPVRRAPGPSPQELNAAFSRLTLPEAPVLFPTADHCLAHLKLLNSFQALKEDIGYTDGLFGLRDERCEVLEGKERDEALAKTREKRWALYIARGVERFEVWWLKYLCILEDSKRLETKQMISTTLEYTTFTGRGTPLQWTTAMLPPLGKDHNPGDAEVVTDVPRYSHGLACFHA